MRNKIAPGLRHRVAEEGRRASLEEIPKRATTPAALAKIIGEGVVNNSVWHAAHGLARFDREVIPRMDGRVHFDRIVKRSDGNFDVHATVHRRVWQTSKGLLGPYSLEVDASTKVKVVVDPFGEPVR